MRFPTEPGGLGHEAWGVVDAVGAEVEGFAPGDRVVTLSQHSYAEYDIAEVGGGGAAAGGARRAAVPGRAARLRDEHPARARGIEPGQTVAIVGIGFLGALLTRLAANAGARVIAIARRPFALEVGARGWERRRRVAMDDHWRIIEAVRTLTGGRFCERVIEAVGKQWPLDLAAELTAERGRLVIAGYHQDGPRQVEHAALELARPRRDQRPRARPGGLRRRGARGGARRWSAGGSTRRRSTPTAIRWGGSTRRWRRRGTGPRGS